MADLSGKRFGKLFAIGATSRNGHGYSICQCDCGNRFVTRNDGLKSGETVSCGCYNKEKSKSGNSRRTHGQAGKRLYKIWQNMKARCYNKNVKQYKDYGGRGITVCSKWKDNFSAFQHWAINSGYRDDLTIERIDNNGDYSEDNCKWVTLSEQQGNKRNNHIAVIDGVSHTLTQWARIYNIKPSVVNWRVNNGWDVKKALTVVIKNGKA